MHEPVAEPHALEQKCVVGQVIESTHVPDETPSPEIPSAAVASSGTTSLVAPSRPASLDESVDVAESPTAESVCPLLAPTWKSPPEQPSIAVDTAKESHFIP